MLKHTIVLAAFIVPALAHAQAMDVTVVNPQNVPAHVMPPSDTLPVVLTAQVSAFSGISSVASFGDVVPVGYRLMIDHVAFFGRTPSIQRLWGLLHPCDNLKGSPWGLVAMAPTSIIEDSTLTNAIHFGNVDTSIYLDPGCTPAVHIQRNSAAGGFSAWITLQGHLVPVLAQPAPGGQGPGGQ